MTLSLGPSAVEALAASAASRSDLGGFNLSKARNDLSQLLAAIGTTQEFSTYTKHDITHIDALLTTADWLIGDVGLKEISVADALIITLSIYVHDLGMLVTKDEFENRDQSDFASFKALLLSDVSATGVDFKDRLDSLETADREHFLYEEFVRTNHAERIELWMRNLSHDHLGVATAASELVADIFRDLPDIVRQDIALIARSHHLDDLGDTSKYKLKRAYGGSADDMANLQYAAIILRSADLLHMSRDRTPTIQYRLANPRDPLGQREWKKQRAVRAVVAGSDDDVEVHASFADAEGFFSLMSYLDYCDEQLSLSSAWSSASIDAQGWNKYSFRWKSINRDSVETDGFEPREFSFKLDQHKVLDLLTGHTLYNDASVAIREISQNAIDAVRLSHFDERPSRTSKPQPFDEDVLITYDSKKRVLRVIDHGVGMTQTTIEEHFLHAGSSSYQSKDFVKKYPGFTSISRFGIGVLSAFMIADEVKVATITKGEQLGRELVLKSVHGQYLVKNFDRASDAARRIGRHGTEVELRLRASADLEINIIQLLNKWLVVPNCQVSAQIDNQPKLVVGHDSVGKAIEARIAEFTGKRETRVSIFTFPGIEVAIPQVWNETYKEWDAVYSPSPDSEYAETNNVGANRTPTTVCVQGIHVTDRMPGFRHGAPVMGINLTGSSSPTTNVARTDLEAGPRLDAVIVAGYTALLNSILGQIPEVAERVSLRFALTEAALMYRQATNRERGRLFTKISAMESILVSSAIHPVESNGALEAASSESMAATGFLTLVGPAAEDAARFLEWAPKPIGLLSLLRDGGLLDDAPDAGTPLLGDFKAMLAWDSLLWNAFEPEVVTSLESGTSLLLKFRSRVGAWRREPTHLTLTNEVIRILNEHVERNSGIRYRVDGLNYFDVDSAVSASGMQNYDGIVLGSNRLFFGWSPIAELYKRLETRIADASDATIHSELATFITMCDTISPRNRSVEFYSPFADALGSWLEKPEHADWVEIEGLSALAAALPNMKMWSSSNAWQARRGGLDD